MLSLIDKEIEEVEKHENGDLKVLQMLHKLKVSIAVKTLLNCEGDKNEACSLLGINRITLDGLLSIHNSATIGHM
jgi:DNA-binding protein Fis